MVNFYEEEHFVESSEIYYEEKDSIIIGSDVILDLNLKEDELYRTTGNIETGGFVTLEELLIKISEAIVEQIKMFNQSFTTAYVWILKTIQLERAVQTI